MFSCFSFTALRSLSLWPAFNDDFVSNRGDTKEFGKRSQRWAGWCVSCLCLLVERIWRGIASSFLNSLSSQLVSSSPNWCLALKQFSPHTRPDVPLRLIDRITGGTGPDFIFILGLGYILTSVYIVISNLNI